MLCIIFSELKFSVPTVDFSLNSQDVTQIQKIGLIWGGLKNIEITVWKLQTFLYELQCF